MKRNLLAILCVWVVWSTVVLYAQTTPQTSHNGGKRPALVRLSGSLGLNGDFFRTSRVRQTAPDLLGRVYSDFTLHLGKVQLQSNILYSSEQNRFQESLNQLGLRGRWRGLSFSVGDHYPTLSTFSLNGTKVKGLSAQMDLGGLFVSGSWGTNGVGKQKDLESGLKYEAYTQDIRALRIGLGKPDGTHLHVVVFSANDDSTSVEGRLQTIKPQQNLSLSTSTSIKLFKGAFQLNGEATGSAFNPNQFGSKIDLTTFSKEQGIPESATSFLSKFFTPTSGTGLSYALKGDTRIRLPFGGLNGSGRYIAPGFSALGAPGVISDAFDWSAGANIGLAKGKVIASGQYSRNQNNLSGLLLSTTQRHVYSANLQLQPVPAVTLVGGFQRMESKTEGEIQAASSQTFTSWNLSPTLTIARRNGRLHNVSFNFTLNEFGAPALPQQGASNFRNVGGMASLNSMLGKGLSLLASATYMKDSSAFSNGMTQGFNAGFIKPLL
ncbi:MAG TPA: hypothetical protein DIW24_03355, partial [Bacteroidetes bacterium]|nr:hypothetical protein [Bacteroidota bacterium]